MQPSLVTTEKRFTAKISACQNPEGYWQGKFSVAEENGRVLTGLCITKCKYFENAIQDADDQVKTIIKNCRDVPLFNYWLRQYPDI